MKRDSASLIAEMKRGRTVSGIASRPGVAEADVREFAQRYGIRMSAALAEYFQAVDGMNAGDADENLIRFWPLVEVRPAALELP